MFVSARAHGLQASRLPPFAAALRIVVCGAERSRLRDRISATHCPLLATLLRAQTLVRLSVLAQFGGGSCTFLGRAAGGLFHLHIRGVGPISCRASRWRSDRPYPETFAKPCASRTRLDPGPALWNCQLPHAYGARDRGVRCERRRGESSRTGPAEADHTVLQAGAIEQDLLAILTRTGIAPRRRRRRRSTGSNIAGWARQRRRQICLELSAPAQRGYGRTGRRRRNA